MQVSRRSKEISGQVVSSEEGAFQLRLEQKVQAFVQALESDPRGDSGPKEQPLQRGDTEETRTYGMFEQPLEILPVSAAREFR